MSEELQLKTKDFLGERLKVLQAEKAPQHMANLEPQRWLLIAKQCMSGKGKVTTFLREHNVTRKMYYSISNDLRGLGDFEKLRAEWGHEQGAMIDAKQALEWEMIERYGKQVESGETIVEAKDITQITRSRQADFDTFQKATGGNAQKIIVEHKTTIDEALAFAAEAAKQVTEIEAEEVPIEQVDDEPLIGGHFCGFND